jgi:hypothetical protein
MSAPHEPWVIVFVTVWPMLIVIIVTVAVYLAARRRS